MKPAIAYKEISGKSALVIAAVVILGLSGFANTAAASSRWAVVFIGVFRGCFNGNYRTTHGKVHNDPGGWVERR